LPAPLVVFGWPRSKGMTFALVGALALLLDRELAIANPPSASPIAAFWARAARRLCDERKRPASRRRG
jgi:hypothetical protein